MPTFTQSTFSSIVQSMDDTLPLGTESPRSLKSDDTIPFASTPAKKQVGGNWLDALDSPLSSRSGSPTMNFGHGNAGTNEDQEPTLLYNPITPDKSTIIDATVPYDAADSGIEPTLIYDGDNAAAIEPTIAYNADVDKTAEIEPTLLYDGVGDTTVEPTLIYGQDGGDGEIEPTLLYDADALAASTPAKGKNHLPPQQKAPVQTATATAPVAGWKSNSKDSDEEDAFLKSVLSGVAAPVVSALPVSVVKPPAPSPKRPSSSQTPISPTDTVTKPTAQSDTEEEREKKPTKGKKTKKEPAPKKAPAAKKTAIGKRKKGKKSTDSESEAISTEADTEPEPVVKPIKKTAKPKKPVKDEDDDGTEEEEVVKKPAKKKGKAAKGNTLASSEEEDNNIPTTTTTTTTTTAAKTVTPPAASTKVTGKRKGSAKLEEDLIVDTPSTTTTTTTATAEKVVPQEEKTAIGKRTRKSSKAEETTQPAVVAPVVEPVKETKAKGKKGMKRTPTVPVEPIAQPTAAAPPPLAPVAPPMKQQQVEDLTFSDSDGKAASSISWLRRLKRLVKRRCHDAQGTDLSDSLAAIAADLTTPTDTGLLRYNAVVTLATSCKDLSITTGLKPWVTKLAKKKLTLAKATAKKQPDDDTIKEMIREAQKILALVACGVWTHVRPAAPLKDDTTKQVLWVDDKPENNEGEVEEMTKAGIKVTQVKSTSEAIGWLLKNKDLRNAHPSEFRVITDSYRPEDAEKAAEAVIGWMRQNGYTHTPVFVYIGCEPLEVIRWEINFANVICGKLATVRQLFSGTMHLADGVTPLSASSSPVPQTPALDAVDDAHVVAVRGPTPPPVPPKPKIPKLIVESNLNAPVNREANAVIQSDCPIDAVCESASVQLVVQRSEKEHQFTIKARCNLVGTYLVTLTAEDGEDICHNNELLLNFTPACFNDADNPQYTVRKVTPGRPVCGSPFTYALSILDQYGNPVLASRKGVDGSAYTGNHRCELYVHDYDEASHSYHVTFFPVWPGVYSICMSYSQNEIYNEEVKIDRP